MPVGSHDDGTAEGARPFIRRYIAREAVCSLAALNVSLSTFDEGIPRKNGPKHRSKPKGQTRSRARWLEDQRVAECASSPTAARAHRDGCAERASSPAAFVWPSHRLHPAKRLWLRGLRLGAGILRHGGAPYGSSAVCCMAARPHRHKWGGTAAASTGVDRALACAES